MRCRVPLHIEPSKADRYVEARRTPEPALLLEHVVLCSSIPLERSVCRMRIDVREADSSDRQTGIAFDHLLRKLRPLAFPP
jgi:hypothetical protein